MFCGNCGKEIIGDTMFCTFCGAHQNAVVLTSPGTPAVTADEPMNSNSNTANISNTIDEAAESVSSSESIHTQSDPENSIITNVPTPNTIPTNNMGEPAQSIPPVTPDPITAGIPSQPVITIKNEEKPERKYSLKHIVMCLAAAAVMAVAAGVFAGLYFSVIFTK